MPNITDLELEKLKTRTLWLRYNHNHDSKGRFSSGGGGGGGSSGDGLYAGKEGRNYGESDTSDAMKELNNGIHNSLENYLDKDGNLSPERAALHKKIIDDYLAEKKPAEGQGEMLMMGGGPASGKSSAIKSGQVKAPKDAVVVDPDDIKTKLPGYSEMAKQSDAAAAFYHEESSMIGKQLANVSFDENYNVLYDGTGDGSEKSVMKKVAAARAHGYEVNATYVTIDTSEAIIRNQKRYEDGVAKGENPRKVPQEYVVECHAKVSAISVACADKFDNIQVFDNNGPVGSKPTLIATGGNGKKLSAVKGQEANFQKYVNKANDLNGK